MQASSGRWLVSALLCASVLLGISPLFAAELIVDVGSKKTLTTEELLARPDVTTIQVPDDPAYHRAKTYRAVPLRALLGADGLPADQALQVTGTDGYVTNLPSNLVSAEGKAAVPWVAIEPPGQPWQKTPDGAAIGPFYLVWLDPAASGVTSEQWPYMLASIHAVPVNATKWPQIMVGNEVPADSPIRTGQNFFAAQCMACHRLNGGGDATLGPDLNIPHNPTEYWQPWALKALIRNPGSVRIWPEMKMHGFDASVLKDGDIDTVIAYLGYMAAHRH